MLKVCIIGYGRAGKIQMQACENVCKVVKVIDPRASVQNSLSDMVQFSTVISDALDDDIDAVIITTPTATHFEICKICLAKNKHIFVEKPLATTVEEYKELYALAANHHKLLFVGFNRRFDPEYSSLKEKIKNKKPLHISVTCKDHPFPPASYLQTCGSIFRDCVVHDIDMMCHTLGSYPQSVLCSCDENGETASTTLTFTTDNGECNVNMIHSRHSPTYEQFVSVHCTDGSVGFGRDLSEIGTSFDQRYKDSYKNQIIHFCKQISTESLVPHIDLSHSLQIERIIHACEESALKSSTQYIKTLRAYDAAETRVKELYQKARIYHTVETTKNLQMKYQPGSQGFYPVWRIFELLKQFKDVSDPDVDVPNDQHALQTAESIRNAGLPDWMQLIGLIHDFGKVLHIFGNDEDGTSMSTQFSLVGDTFVVGHPIPDTIVFPEFNKLSKDTRSNYSLGCGLDNCLISYGHDEYLYQVLLKSKTLLPLIALKIIRYHSLYVWHDKNEYEELENDEDRLSKGWVKIFNQHDLYSKKNNPVKLDHVKQYYDVLIEKYLPNGLML